MAAMAAARALTVNQYLERRNRYDGLCANMEVTPTYDRAPASREVPLFPSGRPQSPVPVALPVVALPPPLSPPTPLRAAQRPGRAALPPPSPPLASEPPTPLRHHRRIGRRWPRELGPPHIATTRFGVRIPIQRLVPTDAYRALQRYRHVTEGGVPIQYVVRRPSRPT